MSANKICVKADTDNIDEVFSFIEGEIEAAGGISRKDVLKLHMIVDEIFANIASYAYEDKKGDVWVEFKNGDPEGAVSIIFTDEGRPYNPVEAEDPDVTLSAKERKVGGLGIFMVKKTVDDIRYDNRDGMNILTLVKKIQAES